MVSKIPDVFSTHSAAKFCRVTPMTIIRWIEEGRIRAYKTPGGHRRIMRVDLEDFCRSNKIPMQWADRIDAGGPRRILIVDDDPAVVEAILDAIFDEDNPTNDDGYKVEHTDNAFDAGRLLVSMRPHVMFLDTTLPGLDLKRVVQSIRKDPSLQHIRLVGIGSDGTCEPVEFDEILSRPIAKKAVRRVTGPLPDISVSR